MLALSKCHEPTIVTIALPVMRPYFGVIFIRCGILHTRKSVLSTVTEIGSFDEVITIENDRSPGCLTWGDGHVC